MACACVHHGRLRHGGFLGRVFADTERMDRPYMAQSTGWAFRGRTVTGCGKWRGSDIETEVRTETQCEWC